MQTSQEHGLQGILYIPPSPEPKAEEGMGEQVDGLAYLHFSILLPLVSFCFVVVCFFSPNRFTD